MRYNRPMGQLLRALSSHHLAADFGMALVVLIWGTNFVIIKSTFTEMSLPFFVTLRFAAGSLLMLFVLRIRDGRLALPRGNFTLMFVLGLVGHTLYQSFFMWGLSQTSAANSSLILTATPILVATIGVSLGHERMRLSLLASLLLGSGGIALIFLVSGQVRMSSISLRGDLLMIGAMLCWTVYTIVLRLRATSLNALYLTTWSTIAGAILLILLNGFSLFRADWGSFSLAAWLGLSYSAVVGLVIAYLLWNMSVQRVGGVRTTIYLSLIPFVAAISAWLVLDEELTLYHIVGGVMITLSVWLSRRS